MAEIVPANGGNRTFLIIVGGLAALLVIALIALAAVFGLPPLLGKRGQVSSAGTVTPTRVAAATFAPQTSATKPATPALATATLQPTAMPTSAPVAVAPATATTTGVASPTGGATPTGGTSTGGTGAAAGGPGTTGTGTTTGGGQGGTNNGELPSSGLGDSLVLLAGGLALVVVIFAARLARALG
ncbi:MAG: hypothetical protein ACM3JD_01975 [Rudaea sp.]